MTPEGDLAALARKALIRCEEGAAPPSARRADGVIVKDEERRIFGVVAVICL